MTNRLKGKKAFVTGGSRGIGQAICLALAKEGVDVAFSFVSTSKQVLAKEVALKIESYGVQCLYFQTDVSNRSEVKKSLYHLIESWGTIDILVNNAGIAQEKPFDEITDTDWDRMLQINLKGAFIYTQELLPGMIKQHWGRIINITSIGGQWGGVNQIHYAVAKAGLIGLTRSIAKVYSQDGITCNAIAPGLIATDMISDELKTQSGQEKLNNIPAGRLGQTDEVAAAAVYLASEQASYITGQTTNLNGGMYFG